LGAFALPSLARACVGALLAALLAAHAAAAAELVYVREAGCPYCKMWDERIGPIYGKTAEGKAAPLRSIDKRSPELAAIKLSRPIRYTPTFVLVTNEVETGRIEGYPGEDFFFPRLARLLEEVQAGIQANPATAFSGEAGTGSPQKMR
jgi:hypothetical protein